MSTLQSTAPRTIPNEEFPQRGWVFAAVLIAVGAILRIVSFHYSDNAGGDAFARLEGTAKWLQNPVFKIDFHSYAPGHFWLIALFNYFFHDIVFSGRFLSLVAGIASLYFVWKLARNLYGELAGILGLAVFVFYSLHIGYSTTSSAEVIYLSFLLAGMMFFFGYFRDESRKFWRLAVAGLSLSASETIRMEAWVIFFGLGITLAVLEYQDQASRPGWLGRWLPPILIFGLTAGAWPIFYMIYGFVVFHDPLVGMTRHNEIMRVFFHAHHVPLVYQLALMPGALLIGLSPLAALAAVYGLFKSFFSQSRLAAAFAALTLFFAAVQAYEIIVGKLLGVGRYTITLGAMLAVIAGFGLERLCAKFPARSRRLAYAFVILFLMANLATVYVLAQHPSSIATKMGSLSPRLRFTPWVAGAGKYLRAHMQPGDGVMIDNYNEESNIVAETAGLGLELGPRDYLATLVNEQTPQQFLASQKPRFLVYSDQGTLRSSLTVPPGCVPATIENAAYKCVFSNKIYRVYERVDSGN